MPKGMLKNQCKYSKNKDIIILSHTYMEDTQAQNFKNFVDRFQLAEQLEKGDKGVIFIGNTRAGKTTLSCAAAGSRINIKHNSKYQLSFLHPVDLPYADKSVTTTPNFFRNNQLAIVDMPGYADNSRFRQFINYHYIKTMITNLKQIRFLVVITLSYSDGKYCMEPKEKRMLQSFIDTFPDCKDCTSIIINRVEIREGIKLNELNKEAEAVKGAFRNIIQQSQKIKTFQTLPGERIHVIFRPPFKANKDNTDWSESYQPISQTMRSICFNQDARYMNISTLKTKVQIFKEGDNIQNQNFKVLLEQFLRQEQQATKNLKECFQSILIQLLKGLISKKMNEQLYQIEKVLEQLQKKDITKQYKNNISLINIDNHNTKYTLTQSKIIKLLMSLFSLKIEFNKDTTQASILTDIDSIFGQLSWITNSLFFDNQLQKRMNYLHIFIVRRLKQTLFIYKALIDQQIMNIETLESIRLDIIENCNSLSRFQSFQKIFGEYLKKITDQFLEINLKNRFGSNFFQNTKDELIETLERMKYLYDKRIIVTQNNLIEKYLLRVDQKIKEVQLYFVIVPVPNNPIEIKNNIEKLLKVYPTIENREQKNIVAFKLAGLLAKQERRNAIALYFHQEIYQQVLKLIEELLQQTKNQPKKKEIALKWYIALADEFKAKNLSYYFERCLQKAKLYALQDYDKMNEIKKQLKQGLAVLSKAAIKNSSLEQQKKREEQTSRKIDQEITFIRILHKLQPQASRKNLKAIGINFRQ